MTEPGTNPTANTPTLSRPWLLHPALDAVVGLGLVGLPLVLMADALAGRMGSTVAVAFAGLTLVVGMPHHAAAIARAWRTGARLPLWLLSAAAVVAIAVGHVWPPLLPVLLMLHLSWSPLHYASQNHTVGLVLLLRGTRHNTALAPNGTETLALKAAHVVAALAAVLHTHAGASDPLVLRANLPAQPVALGAGVALVAALLVAVVVGRRWLTRGVPPRLVSLALLPLAATLSWFVVAVLLHKGEGVGSYAYASGGLAIAHGAQHLWLSTFAAGRDAKERGGRFDGLLWAGLLLGGGVALFVVVPWASAGLLGHDLAISGLVVLAVVNLHHNMLEAVGWRLEHPSTRRALLHGDDLAAADRAQVGNAPAAIVTLVVALLLTLGLVDIYTARAGWGEPRAEAVGRAMVFSSNDSRLWVAQARLALKDGDADGARAALGRALELSPFNPDAQRSLAQLHAGQGRYDEAWARRQAAPRHVLDDPDSRLLFATVGLKLGHLPEAEADAQAVLAQLRAKDDPLRVEAAGILGRIRLRQGKAAEARALLRGALDDAEQILGRDPLPAGQLLDVALALAEAHVALEQADPALLLWERALKGAEEADRADVAFAAIFGRARVFDKRDDFRAALAHLQQALNFADQVDDADLLTRAWTHYAMLLARSNAPMKTRYAVALKARAAAEQIADTEERGRQVDALSESIHFVEEVLPAAEREDVRTRLDDVVRDSFELAYPDADEVPPVPLPQGGLQIQTFP